MLKSMKKVKAVSRLAKGEPHGCNVGDIFIIIRDKSENMD